MIKFKLFSRLSPIFSLALGFLFFSIQPANSSVADSTQTGLLFYLSAENGTKADYAAGKGIPNYVNNVKVIPDGAHGKALHCEYRQLLSYWAQGNIYAQRGTLSFDWRSAEPFTKTEFPIFRVGFADHSSWDMVWLRIDYNGNGFDAFVTDVNLARIRVSYKADKMPAPEQWSHFALSWDENQGVKFYINGEKVAQKDTVVVLNTGLDQFGPHSRIISPYQVQSAYNFMRGGDIDEIRIYDQPLTDNDIMALSKGNKPQQVKPIKRDLTNSEWGQEWAQRYGWNRNDTPPYLSNNNTTVRKVQILDAYDIKRWYWKANDGIRETTWPGVYNRSRIIGRNDYFQLPDWDCYSLSGQSVRFNMPDEPWNYVEIQGGADGKIAVTADKNGNNGKQLFDRTKGNERTFHKIDNTINGETIVFTNNTQETPIGEFNTFYVHEGDAPEGIVRLAYRITAHGDFTNPNISDIQSYINGRYTSDERSMMLGTPASIPVAKHQKNVASNKLPLVHIMIPSDFRSAGLGSVFAESQMPRYLSYTWANMYGGLDGIRIELPAMDVQPVKNGLFPMNIQVKDPIWPLRDMIDFSFSVKPNEARVLWLDLRDRILPNDKPLYITLAGAGTDFNTDLLEGAKIELVFKPWEEAKAEHTIDRFTQVRDNYAMIIEEGPNNRRLNKYNQIEADMTDLLRIEPNHYPGRNYWYAYNEEQVKPDFTHSQAPSGVPLWAFRQLEILKSYRRQIEWYVDNRQIENGEFGGGISDDTDLGNWFPPLALMGSIPDKLNESLGRLLDASYDQGMLDGGMSVIQTDGLHTFEEGTNTLGQINLLRIGDPKQVERMMEAARSVRDKLIGVNQAGHSHFRSDYFSATKMAETGSWTWSSPRQFLHLIPAIFLGELYGNSGAKEQVIAIADGLLAHSRTNAIGEITLDTEINFATDESRSSSIGHAVPVLVAAWQWTGNQKYLKPLKDAKLSGITTATINLMDMAGLRPIVAKQIAENIENHSGSDAVKHLAWQITGNKKFLESYYANQIENAAATEYINTQGSLWIDRFVFAIDEIQRSRLGGVSHTRRSFFPGNVVSWRFDDPYLAEKIAILIPDATPNSFHVELFNTTDKTINTEMTGWEVLGGKWEMTEGIDKNGDGVADTQINKKQVSFGRNEKLQISAPSKQSLIVSMKLIGRGEDNSKRVDLGIGKEDVAINNNKITVTVHNLGGVDSRPTPIALLNAAGAVISQTMVPTVKAPLDLLPKTTDVVINIPEGIDLKGCTIQIDPQNKTKEITKQNNVVYVTL